MKAAIIIGVLVLCTIAAGCSQQCPTCPALQCPACSCPAVTQPKTEDGQLYLYTIDVAQGDAHLIKQGDSEMLIDCGKNSEGGKVTDFLKNHGVTSLEYMIITHPDSDHLGGCDDVLRQYSPAVIINGETATTLSYDEVQTEIAKKNLQTMIARPGDIWQLGRASVKVIQANNGFADTNENSIVVKVTYSNFSELFTGDCEKQCEDMLINKDIQAKILKVGHHGTKFATSISFLDKVDPRIALISVGKDNSYGHPAQNTIDRLSQENVLVYRTDVYGTITVKSDGQSYEVI